MTILDPITEKNVQALPLGTNLASKPVAAAEKIRHAAPVPGATKNSTEDWVAHLHGSAVQAYAALPSAADYDEGTTIVVDGRVYVLSAHEDNTLRLQAAAATAGSYRGYAVSLPGTVGPEGYGALLHDPVAADGSAALAGLSSLRYAGQGR